MKRIAKSFLFVLLLAGLVIPAGAQTAGELKLPAYKKAKLKNGMTLLLMEQHEVPLVSFNAVIRAGGVTDPAGKEGIASVVAGLLRKGTKSRTADQLSAELDFIGGVLNAGAGTDSSNVSGEFVKKDLAKGLDLLSDVMMNPIFPQDEATKLLKQRLDGIKSAKDQAQGVIGQYYNSYLYGAHPYARPAGGDETSLAAITRDDIVKFYESNYVPGNIILAVVGDFQTAEMEKILTDKFSAWQSNAMIPAPKAQPAKKPARGAKPAQVALTPAVPAVAPVQGKRLLLVDKPDATQTFFRIGNVGIARTSPDRVGIQVVNTLFGGRFTSWLSTELRIKNGLTYGAGSFWDERMGRGPFAINSFTPNATTERCIDLALAQLKRLHEQGISEEELKSAKSYVKGQFPPNIETSDQLARAVAELEFYGLDEKEINTFYAKIDALTVADTRRIVQQYFPLDNLVFVLIGKASEIGPVAKKYAPKMDTKSISQPGF
ncbi:MAG: insulinase family protein [Acidobacteria bacterium]|nr:insulinase family protein [Acidobacteriota bacterium]MCL5286558.1 insulinase family protein [Acidobacteriota bacterium]